MSAFSSYPPLFSLFTPFTQLSAYSGSKKFTAIVISIFTVCFVILIGYLGSLAVQKEESENSKDKTRARRVGWVSGILAGIVIVMFSYWAYDMWRKRAMSAPLSPTSSSVPLSNELDDLYRVSRPRTRNSR